MIFVVCIDGSYYTHENLAAAIEDACDSENMQPEEVCRRATIVRGDRISVQVRYEYVVAE